jgi:hypothetical protein
MKALLAFALMSVLGIGMGAATAPHSPASAPAAGAKNEQGLTAALIVNKGTYVLNPAQAGAAFRNQLEQLKSGKVKGRLPQPPAVELTFRITNTTEKPVTLEIGGDNSQMDLQLDGSGAVTVDNNVAMTMEFRLGTPVTIAAGKTYDLKITSLAFGFRGISKYAYWTEPGDYHLTASYTSDTSEKKGTLTSAPVTIKITKE